jgi:hypothetical protein
LRRRTARRREASGIKVGPQPIKGARKTMRIVEYSDFSEMWGPLRVRGEYKFQN